MALKIKVPKPKAKARANPVPFSPRARAPKAGQKKNYYKKSSLQYNDPMAFTGFGFGRTGLTGES